MIHTLDRVKHLDVERISITSTERTRVLIEVASDRPVDLAIVTPQQWKNFQAVGKEHDFDFIERQRTYEFVVDVSPESPMALLVWNANYVGDAFVAFKMSELTAAGATDHPARELVSLPG